MTEQEAKFLLKVANDKEYPTLLIWNEGGVNLPIYPVKLKKTIYFEGNDDNFYRPEEINKKDVKAYQQVGLNW